MAFFYHQAVLPGQLYTAETIIGAGLSAALVLALGSRYIPDNSCCILAIQGHDKNMASQHIVDRARRNNYRPVHDPD